jgi:hypothetical protein
VVEFFRNITGIVVLITLAACATSQTGGGVVPGQTVRPASRIMVLPIPDGVERKDGAAAGTGGAMTAGIRDALIQAGVSPLVTEQTGLEGAIKQARSLGYDYVLKATITEWEDNATEWSGRPDSAAVSAELYDARSMQLVSTATQREEASVMAVVPQNPERFIPTLSRRIVEKLLGVTLPDAAQKPTKQ